MSDTYRIVYSFLRDGKRIRQGDECYAISSGEALDIFRRWYGDLDGYRVENLWIEGSTSD